MKIDPTGSQRPADPRRPTAPPRGLFTEHERRRMIFLIFGAVVFAGAMFWQWSRGLRQPAPGPETVDEAPAEAEVVKPALRIDDYRRLAKDATAADRSVLETEALATALEDARLYHPAHFAPMGGVDLDGALVAELAAASEANRGRIVRVRGTIEQIVEYPAGERMLAHFRGRLRTEDGARVHFAALRFAEGADLGVDDYLQLEGLFLKNLAQSAPEGWVEGPLLVGPRALRSYPAIEVVESISPADFFAVEDDTPEDEAYDEGFDDKWKLVSYVAQLQPGEVDWASAPVLDRKTMAALSADPAAFRAVPVRIPPCRVQHMWTQRQDENPARIPVLTEGWLGSQDWQNTANPVLYFVSPAPNPGVKIGGEVTARGYFLRMFRYDARTAGLRVAPLFVLAGIERWTPPSNRVFVEVLWYVGGSFLAMVAVFAVLLRRDRRQAEQLEADLLRRRRARRMGTAQG
jgi:hypothetical protein